MSSTRSFMRLWLGLTVLVLAYAAIDLWMHPWLAQESHFTMRPDLTQIGDLWHWGGRLLKEDALVLLVGNAVILAGVLALVVSGMARLWRKLRRTDQTAETEAPASERVFAATPSVPPPAL